MDVKEGKAVYVSMREKTELRNAEMRGVEQNKRENALRMLRSGLAVGDIAKFIDLPEEEVRRLGEETRN